MLNSTMTETKEIPTSAPDEPFLGTIDLILLVVLLIGGVYWLLKRNRKEEKPPTRSYSIQPTQINTTQSADNSFIKKLKASGRSLVVFYGSQTGTGEEFAGRLAKEGIRYQLKGMVADPEECDMEELLQLKTIPKSLAVFCLATYGEGDPTDNAMEFYDWIQGDVDLSGLNYAVFGLGNKTYEHYNKVAIYVDKRLEELGATRVFELGLGDDDANIEDDFITWKERLWPTVCDYFGIESTGEDVLIRQYRLLEQPDVAPDRIYTGEVARLHSLENQRPPFDAKNPFLATLIVNHELHKAGDRSCMHIEFDIDGSKMRYEAGDHIALYPTNDKDFVERLGQLCNADLDTKFSLINTDTESSKKHPFPCPTTYRTALTHYIEITAIPRTHILNELAEYCTDEKDKEFLKMLASTTPEGKAQYQSWIHDACRNIVHILEDIKSCKAPIDHICEILPRLQPRYYSISSSAKLYPKVVHVTAVLVQYETKSGRLNKGVATTYLAQRHPEALAEKPKVPVFIRKSQFRLPNKTETPVIMIGPGTGLAPFRGFIQERDLCRQEGKIVGDTILYFGCRKRTEDYIYENELENYAKNGTLKLRLAFSRDQPEKIYVTNLLREDEDLVWNVIENKGHIYICGDAKNMATDVRNILLHIIKTKGNMDEAGALQYIKKMEAQKRYSADVWS